MRTDSPSTAERGIHHHREHAVFRGRVVHKILLLLFCFPLAKAATHHQEPSGTTEPLGINPQPPAAKPNPAQPAPLPVMVKLNIKVFAFPAGSAAKQLGKMAPNQGEPMILKPEEAKDLIDMKGVTLAHAGRTLAEQLIPTMSGHSTGFHQQGNENTHLSFTITPTRKNDFTRLTVDISVDGYKPANVKFATSKGDSMLLILDPLPESPQTDEVILLIKPG